jgi:hypothetical protein
MHLIAIESCGLKRHGMAGWNAGLARAELFALALPFQEKSMFRLALALWFVLGLGFAGIGCDRGREIETPSGEVETEREPFTGDRELEIETPREESEVEIER